MPDSLSHHGRSLDVGQFGINQSDLPHFEQGQIDIRQWFDEPTRDRPLELEIGSGKGTFLVQQAPLQPDINFLGIEYAAAYWRHAADRVRRNNIRNVRLLYCEADFFLRNYVPDATFQQVHIYFPDPWPKKRHNKRRLVQAPFLRELSRVLTPNGRIRLATDHFDYFAWMEEHAAQVEDIYERLPFEKPESAGEGELVGTNFERKYREEGRVFNGMVLVKR